MYPVRMEERNVPNIANIMIGNRSFLNCVLCMESDAWNMIGGRSMYMNNSSLKDELYCIDDVDEDFEWLLVRSVNSRETNAPTIIHIPASGSHWNEIRVVLLVLLLLLPPQECNTVFIREHNSRTETMPSSEREA